MFSRNIKGITVGDVTELFDNDLVKAGWNKSGHKAIIFRLHLLKIPLLCVINKEAAGVSFDICTA